MPETITTNWPNTEKHITYSYIIYVNECAASTSARTENKSILNLGWSIPLTFKKIIIIQNLELHPKIIPEANEAMPMLKVKKKRAQNRALRNSTIN